MLEESPSPRGASSQRSWWGYAQVAFVLGAIAVALYLARAPDRIDRGALPDVSPDSARPTVTVIRPTSTEQSLTVELTGSVTLEEKASVVSEVVGRVGFADVQQWWLVRCGRDLHPDRPHQA